MIALRFRYHLGLAVVALQLFAGEAHAADRWWGRDKAMHLSAGALISGVCYGSLWAADVTTPPRRMAISVGAGAVAGLGKELIDMARPGHAFSGKDLLWTVIGGLAVSVALYLMDAAVGARRVARVGQLSSGVSSSGAPFTQGWALSFDVVPSWPRR